MGISARHYRALMKKNFINWKRTMCGSIFEILCPVVLMFILMYARSEIEPRTQNNYTLYSLRRPLYPIAKPQLDGQMLVSLPDQYRQMEDYRDFFEYADYTQFNDTITIPINATETLMVASEVIGETALPNIVANVRSTVYQIFNLTAIVEQTPIANFTQVIAWDALERFFAEVGLDAVIDVGEVKARAEELEETLENPEELLQDLTGVNITEVVEFILQPIVQYEVFYIDFELRGYLPMLDPIGPYAFFPKHCFPNMNDQIQEATRYDSPLVGYVKTDSSIEQDVITQLQSLFSAQRELTAMVSLGQIVSLVVGRQLNGINGLSGINLMSNIRLDEMEQFNDMMNDMGVQQQPAEGAEDAPPQGQEGQPPPAEGGQGQRPPPQGGSPPNGQPANGQSANGEARSPFGGDGAPPPDGQRGNPAGSGGMGGRASMEAFTRIQSQMKKMGTFEFKEFASQEELDAYISSDTVGVDRTDPAVCFAFAVHENEAKNKYELELFFNDIFPSWNRGIPNQKSASYDPYAYMPNTKALEFYYDRGFAYMQNWVANTILKRSTGVDNASIVSITVPQRLRPFVLDEFNNIMSGVLSFFLLIMYIPPIYRTTYRIVAEKETKVKESMRMMGLKDFPYWASWFTYYSIVNTVIATIVWAIVYVYLTKFSTGWILFLMIWLYGQSLFGIIMITQSLFTRARAAAIISSIVYFGTALVEQFVDGNDTPEYIQMLGSLSPTVAMIKTIFTMAKQEESQVGTNMSNLWEPYGNFSMGDGLLMMAVDCVYLMLLGFYMEQVMPKTIGTRRNPCFCLLPRYWGCCRRRDVFKVEPDLNQSQMMLTDAGNDLLAGDDILEKTMKFETEFLNPACYERINPECVKKENLRQTLKVEGLAKTYDNGFEAVKGINVKMFSDQIFCLLGHNGAGKTTTISMLTGMLGSTKGRAKLFGLDMFSDMDQVRTSMGVCPQHNVLFDLLTPEEHLDIFYEFKGANQTDKKAEIKDLLADIGVNDKKNDYAYQLSGGNQRKLSIAIALCGGSRFVLLDEPTAGLDISARRSVWELLRRYKKDRIVLLTTHYMDEADILADRIGIMSSGQMTVLGSPMFLKNRFGHGYVMTIVKANSQPNEKIMPYLAEELGPGITKLSEIQGEMTIQIPKDYTILFKDFFEEFDEKLAELDILSYGISVTTLEEVFLSIGHQTDPRPQVTSSLGSAMSKSRPVSHLQANLTQEEFNKNAGVEPGFGSTITPAKDPKITTSLPMLPALPPVGANQGKQAMLEHSLNISDVQNQNLDEESVGQEPNVLDSIGNSTHKIISQAGVTPDGVFDPQRAEELKQASTDPQDRVDATPEGTLQPSESEDQFKDVKFSISEDKLNLSFWNNFAAILIKRFNEYKRNRKAFVSEVLVPALFMVIGVWISSYDRFTRTEPKMITPDVFPMKQQVLINETPRDPNSDVSPALLAENLPDFDTAFEFTFSDVSKDSYVFDDFAEEVFRFGSETCPVQPYHYGSYEVFQADRELQEYKFLSYVNITAKDVSIFYPQYMYESILKVATGDPEFEFKTKIVPYPLTHGVSQRIATTDAGALIFFSAISYSIIITVTVSYLVVERITMLKHIQVISGMRLSSYWIANFIFDGIKLYLTILTTVALFYIFDQEYESTLVVFLLFPLGILPFTYVMSFLFTVDSAAQTFTMFLHSATILVFSTLVFLLRMAPNLEVIGDWVNYGLRAIPSYSLSASMYFEASSELVSTFRNTTIGEGPDISPDQWAWKNNLLDVVMQPTHFVFWFFILFLIEMDLAKRCRRCYTACVRRSYPKRIADLQLDSDVVAEKDRIQATNNDQVKIKVEGLRKVYETKGGCCVSKNLVAVEDISFGLESGECFALLGVNGAGKSTTFKSLTCEIEPTEGSIHIGSLNIRKDFNSIKKLIGYCPQTNPIFEFISVEENIEYFARIKGVPSDIRPTLVEKAIKQLDLQDHRKKLAGTLSGGNKRKLSVAIAIVGSPPIILLDEPSAGMDPEARRFMWRVVSQIASDKTSATILTTHSMEEAEALCSKMGIMVKGGIFKCFGTPQHIKNKFGTGFVVEIKAQTPLKEEIEEVQQGILNFDEILEEEPQLKELLKKNSFSVQEAMTIMAKANVPGIVIESILGLEKRDTPNSDSEQSNLKAKALLEKTLTMNQIAQEIFIQGALFGVIESMCHEFVQVEVLEHYGNYMRLRVERHERTIGALFRLIEELKEEHQLEDYSVSQTTLEQIFQGFADLNFNENVPTFCIDDESGELAKLVNN